ncbi:MAG: hypothetical protein PF795_04545, partial [Kiritimatiellae bacterium]|nr:hypothetical protein [Kiritimatiellia bacterium]
MKSLKTLLISTVSVLALAAVLLGPAKVFSHMNASRDRMQETVDQVSSDKQEVARISALLRQHDETILEYQDKLSDLESQLVDDRKGVDQLASEVEEQRKILTKTREMLEDNASEYTIQGRTYSRHDVEQDALARISHAETLEQRLDLQRQVVRKLEGALADGRENLGKAMAVRREKAGELKTLAARLQNARVLAEVSDIARDLGSVPLAPQSELARAMRNLEQRVRKAERHSEVTESESQDGLKVDWAGKTTHDAKKALDEFLAADPVAAADPAAPDVRAELNRALQSTTT